MSYSLENQHTITISILLTGSPLLILNGEIYVVTNQVISAIKEEHFDIIHLSLFKNANGTFKKHNDTIEYKNYLLELDVSFDALEAY